MRDFPGIPFASLPDIKAPDFIPRLRNILGVMDAWCRDASVGFSRLSNGQVPSGSGHAVVGGGVVDMTTTTSTVQGLNPTSNIQEWRRNGGDLVALIDNSGIFKMGVLEIISVGTGALIALISPSGFASVRGLNVFSGTGDLSLGAVVASIDNAGAATFASITLSGGAVVIDSSGFVDSIPLKDSGTGNVGSLSWAGIGSGDSISIPPGTGTLLTANSTANVSSKTLLNNTNIRCNTANGTTFQDNASTTKQMRFDLSGITAGQTRNQKWQDTAGSVVSVGNAASASGVLGTIALTGQTGSLAAQTMLTGNASSAGLYRLSFYLKTTTAGSGGDIVKVTASWNDGSAQTLDVPMLNATAIVNNLDLGTLNAFVQGSVVLKAAASQNITFTTTVVKAGSPAYLIDSRIEALG